MFEEPLDDGLVNSILQGLIIVSHLQKMLMIVATRGPLTADDSFHRTFPPRTFARA